jgi:hypothetical protein
MYLCRYGCFCYVAANNLDAPVRRISVAFFTPAFSTLARPPAHHIQRRRCYRNGDWNTANRLGTRKPTGLVGCEARKLRDGAEHVPLLSQSAWILERVRNESLNPRRQDRTRFYDEDRERFVPI